MRLVQYDDGDVDFVWNSSGRITDFDPKSIVATYMAAKAKAAKAAKAKAAKVAKVVKAAKAAKVKYRCRHCGKLKPFPASTCWHGAR